MLFIILKQQLLFMINITVAEYSRSIGTKAIIIQYSTAPLVKQKLR